MKNNLTKLLVFISAAYILLTSTLAFEKIASGTGVWLGGYSPKWGSAFFGFTLFCIALLIFIAKVLWQAETFSYIAQSLIALRRKLGIARLVLAAVVFIIPIWFLQFTPWGIIFKDLSIRIIIWALITLMLTFLISQTELLEWKPCLLTLLLTSSSYVVALAFINVTDYPFSLGWSEGNRMWDYSIMFGRELYDYPPEKSIPVLLDPGRQFVGGLPFILPGVTILMERFWIALTTILPYLLLGLATFRFERFTPTRWLLATIWALIFLKQGPIHTPLVLCAIATALVWRSPLWLGIPLIAITSYVAELSRFTWVFAPGLWIGMLEFAGSHLHHHKVSRETWIRAISLGLAGFIGGQYGQNIVSLLNNTSDQEPMISASIPLDNAVSMVTTPTQPLLWYRLLPNETYPLGVLFGLIIATFPLILLLIYFVASRKWALNFWQKIAIVAPLTAFLIVGLIVSAKVGGGGDLHNMDMFLIGLMFTGSLAWEKLDKHWLAKIHLESDWIKIILILFFALPGLFALKGLHSIAFPEEAARLAILTDTTNQAALGMIPTDQVVQESLNIIQQEVNAVIKQDGQVLFIDQRQLLTFDYISNVPLIPEFEKKRLMNEALSGNAKYFYNFYSDLANKRFGLIVSEPLKTPLQDSDDSFGEENNAWVKWVSIPVLCYYDIKTTLQEVNVQLLVPKPDPVDCSAELPVELP